MTAKDLVNGMVKLVSLPHVCIRINLMVDDPAYSTSDIGEVISQDASLTAHLLKVANSAFYGYPAKIETITRAVTVIGTRDLRDLIFAVSAVRTFTKIPVNLANMASFWRHSMFCGIVARLLARECNILHTERMFVAGLLHDIGKLIVYQKCPEESLGILEQVEKENAAQYSLEKACFGFHHGDVGAELMSFWKLPISLQNTIRYHHEPDLAEGISLEASIIHLSNLFAHIAELEGEKDQVIAQINPIAWEITNLSPEIIEPILNEAHPLLFEGLALIIANE